jgi:hypothetical protein
VRKGTSALPLKATAKADFPQTVMSALPPKADMCGAATDVRFGPIADIQLFDDRRNHSGDSLRNPEVSDALSVDVVRRVVRDEKCVRPVPCHQSEGVGIVGGGMFGMKYR